MNQVQRAARHRQKLEQLCAAAVRALSGDADLHFRAGRLHRGPSALALHAPHLSPSPEHDDFSSFRGTMDSVALRRLHSDTATHRLWRPSDPVERLVFELLEQLRVETLVPNSMPGMRQNLLHRFSAWSLAFHHSGATASALGILMHTVAQICWSRLTGQAVLEETQDLIEATRASMAPVLGHELAGLRLHAGAQAAYAQHALAIARIVGEMVRSVASGHEAKRRDRDAGLAGAFGLLLDFGADEGDPGAPASAHGMLAQETAAGYRVFTTSYDRVIHARTLVRPALLRELRTALDDRIRSQHINLGRLVRQLGTLLTEPQRDGWRGGEDEGYIDGSRLAQLVSSPGERRLFQLEQNAPSADCLVSFLIDCSGSMKEHMAQASVLVDIFVRALELAGARTEILGFTTGAWHGGRARRDWLRQGCPDRPGRLNERCHMIYKDAARTWRRARPDIAALLKPDLFREGIDGEAVEWALQRMLERREKRRILIVISDGSPTDAATSLTNGNAYLDNHLKQVVARHEREAAVEIYGVGVGLDLSACYSRSLAIDLSGPLKHELCNEIMQLISRRRRR